MHPNMGIDAVIGPAAGVGPETLTSGSLPVQAEPPAVTAVIQLPKITLPVFR